MKTIRLILAMAAVAGLLAACQQGGGTKKPAGPTVSAVAGGTEMSLGNEKDQELTYDVPYVNLAKSVSGTTKSFTWQQFKQAGWGRGLKITGEEAAKTLASLKFKIQAKDGTSGKFNIMSIGPYNGQCAPSNVAVLP